jgi:hypothetical protein
MKKVWKKGKVNIINKLIEKEFVEVWNGEWRIFLKGKNEMIEVRIEEKKYMI